MRGRIEIERRTHRSASLLINTQRERERERERESKALWLRDTSREHDCGDVLAQEGASLI